MLTLTKQPKLFELSGNPVIVEVLSSTVTNSNHKISVRVKYNGQTIGEEILPVINNVASFDISDYLKREIEGDFNIFDLFQTAPIAFSHLLHSFTLQIFETYDNDGIEHNAVNVPSFYAIQGGFSKLFYDSYQAQGKNFYDNFITADKKFLTWAPSKKLTWNQHEVLFFINTAIAKTLKAQYRLYFNDNTTTDIESAEFTAAANSVVMISPSYLSQVFDAYDSEEKFIIKYTVQVTASSFVPGIPQVNMATIEGSIITGQQQIESIAIEGNIYAGPINQVESITVIGSIGAEDVDPKVHVTVTSALTSYDTIFSVSPGDSAGTVGLKLKDALDVAAITDYYSLSRSGPTVRLTTLTPAINDDTLNISYENWESTGLTDVDFSENTTAGSPSYGAGNAKLTITGALITGSPLNIYFAVANSDSDSIVAGKARTALNIAAITNFYTIGGSGVNIVLTSINNVANDATFNIAYTNDTCGGLIPKSASNNIQAGIAPGTGTAAITITSAIMPASPLTVNVAVTAGDNNVAVAEKIRAAIYIADVTDYFDVSRYSNQITLMALAPAANDSSLNIAYTNGTCVGLTPNASSINVVNGVANSGSDGDIITETKTYYIDRNVYNFGKQFIFRNSLGTYDIIHLKGLSENINEIQRTVGFFQTTDKTSFSEFNENFKSASGFLVNHFYDIETAQRYIIELFNSREIYEIVGKEFIKITPTSSKLKINKDGEFLYSFAFEYGYSHTDQYYSLLSHKQYFNPRIFYTSGIIADVAPGLTATVNFDVLINQDSIINFVLDWGPDVGITYINSEELTADTVSSLTSSIEVPGNVSGTRTLVISDSIGGKYYINYTVDDYVMLFNDGENMQFNNGDQMLFNNV